MNTYLILSIVGTAFFSAVLALFIIWFKLPPSLSETYYNLEKKHKGWGAFFYVYLVVTVFILIAPAVEAAGLWGFLCAAAACFIGAAPRFKEKDQALIHVVSTIISAVSSVIALIVMHKLWVAAIIAAIVIGLAIWTKTYKSSLVFWLEMMAFYSLFIGLIIFFI